MIDQEITKMADISCAECGAGVVVVNGWIEVLDHDPECVWEEGSDDSGIEITALCSDGCTNTWRPRG